MSILYIPPASLEIKEMIGKIYESKITLIEQSLTAEYVTSGR